MGTDDCFPTSSTLARMPANKKKTMCHLMRNLSNFSTKYLKTFFASIYRAGPDYFFQNKIICFKTRQILKMPPSSPLGETHNMHFVKTLALFYVVVKRFSLQSIVMAFSYMIKPNCTHTETITKTQELRVGYCICVYTVRVHRLVLKQIYFIQKQYKSLLYEIPRIVKFYHYVNRLTIFRRRIYI